MVVVATVAANLAPEEHTLDRHLADGTPRRHLATMFVLADSILALCLLVLAEGAHEADLGVALL